MRAGVGVTSGSGEKHQSNCPRSGEEKLEAVAPDQQHLSVRQLVVRRGLTVLFMVAILAVGVFVSELLIRLLTSAE